MIEWLSGRFLNKMAKMDLQNFDLCIFKNATFKLKLLTNKKSTFQPGAPISIVCLKLTKFLLKIKTTADQVQLN